MTPSDVWAVGRAYESYIGRWSRPVAADFVDWLAVPPGAAWLDVGCGTGALAATILARAAPARVLGVDPSSGFLEHARAQVVDPRATFATGDGQALALPDGGFDAAVSGLALNFFPDPPQGAREMARVVRGGGTVAAYVWDYAGRMELLRIFWDAAVALDPAALALDEGRRFPLCDPAKLAALLDGAGLVDVETRAIDVPARFADLDDYWAPFLAGQGPAPTYVTSLEPASRDALREAVRARLPVAGDGSIALVCRAWAVRGRVS